MPPRLIGCIALEELRLLLVMISKQIKGDRIIQSISPYILNNHQEHRYNKDLLYLGLVSIPVSGSGIVHTK